MANKEYLKQLGQFFHDVRISRGITLKEAAGNWSQSNLSRFERGEQDLSASKAVELMMRLGMESDDFYSFYESHYELQRRSFPNLILNYALSYDRKFVEDWQKSYQSAHPVRTNATDYAEVMFDVAIHWHDAGYYLSAEQEQILADRLAVPERFTSLEIGILKLIVGPASHELLVLLRQRIERMDSSLVARRDTRLLSIWLGALMSHDIAFADDLQRQLTPIFSQPEASPLVTQYYSNWKFGVLASAWLHSPTPANEKAIATIIDDLLFMNNRDDAFWFKNMFARMKTSHVHHNLGIVDHPRPMVVSHTLAEVIQQQRQYLGVGVAAVAVGPSSAALRRFEAGKTELGFCALVELAGELGLIPSQILHMINLSADQTGSIGLWSVYLQMSRLNFEEAKKVYQQFALQTPNKPDKVLRMQQFILSSMEEGLADSASMAADAQIVANELMRANNWYRMELLGFQAVINWLPTAKLLLLIHHGRNVFEKKTPVYGVTTYFFDGLSKALIHVVRTEGIETSRSFVQDLKWMTGKNTETPGAWLATGSWLVADAITEPTPKKYAELQQYLQRSIRVGHIEAVAGLKKDWQGLVPADYFAIKQ